MERLTMIDGCGNDELARCMDCGPEKAGADLENCGMCEEGWQRALKRLAAYEDTGLEPEEIERILDAYGRGHTLRTESAERLEIMREVKTDRLREIIRADQEGRLVVLPCGTDAESDVIDDPEWKERMMQKFVGRR